LIGLEREGIRPLVVPIERGVGGAVQLVASTVPAAGVVPRPQAVGGAADLASAGRANGIDPRATELSHRVSAQPHLVEQRQLEDDRTAGVDRVLLEGGGG